MKLRVLLADDHALFRKALRATLEDAQDIEVVAEADGYGVLKGVGESRPDVVCMDINMPGLNGIEATRQLLAIHPHVKVIGLSCDIDPYGVAEMIKAGALGYVDKMSAGAELLQAIRTVNANQVFLSPELDIKDAAGLAKQAMRVRGILG